MYFQPLQLSQSQSTSGIGFGFYFRAGYLINSMGGGKRIGKRMFLWSKTCFCHKPLAINWGEACNHGHANARATFDHQELIDLVPLPTCRIRISIMYTFPNQCLVSWAYTTHDWAGANSDVSPSTFIFGFVSDQASEWVPLSHLFTAEIRRCLPFSISALNVTLLCLFSVANQLNWTIKQIVNL